MGGIDQLGARHQVGRRQQTQRLRDEIRIGEILVAVGKGQFFGFGDQCGGPCGASAFQQRAGIARCRRCADGEIGVCQHPQRHGDGGAARRRWSHAAHPEPAIGDADGVAQLCCIRCKVSGGHIAGHSRGSFQSAENLCCDRALVKRVWPTLGNSSQGGGKCWIFQRVAGFTRGVGSVEEIGSGFVVEAGGSLIGEQLGKAWTDDKARIRQLDGGLEQLFPRQFAMPVMGQFQRRQHAGHARTQPGIDRRIELALLAAGQQKPVGLGGGGRGLAAIDGLNHFGLAIEQENESTAADT